MFKVKGSNNHGLWSNTPASIEIVVLPPFWKSKLAIFVYFVLILSLIYFFIAFKIARSREKDRIKREKLDKVLEATSGNTGFNMLLSNQPDLVLSDVIMPDRDGFEFCSKKKDKLSRFSLKEPFSMNQPWQKILLLCHYYP